LVAACGGGTSTVEPGSTPTPSTPTPPGDPGPYVPLGLNDATILAPVPATASSALMRATDLMDDGTPLVPRALFDRLNTEPFPEAFGNPVVFPEEYDRLQLVAVRFELCDRNLPGPCTGEADGRLRLVLQPFSDNRDGFEDTGFHAFYAIPFAEIAAFVKELRALATIQKAPTKAPLDVSPALAAGNAEYKEKLRALVRRVAGEKTFVRLTMNAQPKFLSQVRWVLRGVEKKNGALASVVIPGIAESTEQIITSGRTGFEDRPVSDTPKGMAEAIDDMKFAAASDARKRELLAVLAAADNPNTSAPDTVSCIACHVSTQVMHARTTSMGIDATSIQGVYTSTYDLSVTGKLRDGRSTRALGWIGREAMISQRVVNDTAQLLVELEARFPR
jgi:hypothetical protein